MTNKQYQTLNKAQPEQVHPLAAMQKRLEQTLRDSGLTVEAMEESDGEYTASIPQGKRSHHSSPATSEEPPPHYPPHDLQNLPEDPVLGAIRARDRRLKELSTLGLKKD